MTDLVQHAQQLVECLERGDTDTAKGLLSERIQAEINQGWSLEEYIDDSWRRAPDELAGSSRRVTAADLVAPAVVMLTLEGDGGRAFVNTSFDEAAGVVGIGIDRRVFEGIANLVIMCTNDRVEEMDAFYKSILGTDAWRIPRFVFGEVDEYHRQPRWSDPDYPQQMHLEVFVQDLSTAEEVMFASGAELLESGDDKRSYADPVGHQIRLERSTLTATEFDEALGILGRVVIDCSNPRALAPFYEALLGMERVEDEAERVVIAKPDGSLPMLVFQQVSHYVAPRWPDPEYPAQMHFDLKFYDREAARATVEKHGGVRLPDQGGSCPVYADPAGHPFCLCMPGE